MKRIPFAIAVFVWWAVAASITFGIGYAMGPRMPAQAGGLILIRGLLYLPLPLLVTARMKDAGRGAWVTVMAWLSLLPVPVLPLVAMIAPLFYPSAATAPSAGSVELPDRATPEDKEGPET